MQRSIVLSELRVQVTGASVDYVGSITIHKEFCDALGLLERQMVHIRNQRTGVDLWTYVIRGQDDACAEGTICLNGAAAHLVQVGDIVSITARGLLTLTNNNMLSAPVTRRWDAVQNGVTNIVQRIGMPPADWAHNVVLEYACGKVHRPRITHIKNEANAATFPALYMDEMWAREGSIQDGEAVHVVNVTNGQRDILTLRYAPAGSKECAIHMGTTASFSTGGYGSRPGYNVGDVIIAMNYGYISRAAVLKGEAPEMSICFPFERPEGSTEDVNLHRLWEQSAKQSRFDVATKACNLVLANGKQVAQAI